MSKIWRKYRLAELASIMKREHKNNRLVSYLINHFNAAIVSLDRIICTPISSLLTIVVIAIALALPFGLAVLLQNAKVLTQNWDKGTQISLYLKMNLAETEKQTLLQQLRSDSNIANVQYISPEEGLETLQKSVDVQGVLKQLQENPLPGVVVITPKVTEPRAVDSLFNIMQQLSAVDSVRLDRTWFERLYYLVEFVRHGFLALLFLFGLGVVFIVGNTIRLALQSSSKEIKVFKLIGANDAYVRRPFLYTGLYYGVAGAGLAWVIVFAAMLWISVPVHDLAASYGGDFILQRLDINGVLTLFGVGAVLGWIGARLAVMKHVRKN